MDKHRSMRSIHRYVGIDRRDTERNRTRVTWKIYFYTLW